MIVTLHRILRATEDLLGALGGHTLGNIRRLIASNSLMSSTIRKRQKTLLNNRKKQENIRIISIQGALITT